MVACSENALKTTLRESYIENVDYKCTQVPNKRGIGRKLEKIMLTADCFKFLCMRSRTAKSQMVRSYYVELEKLVFKYSAAFALTLKERVADLERNQRPKTRPYSQGVIYVIKVSGDKSSVYKLGRSKDFKKRLQSHNSSHMDDFDVVYVLETDMVEEVERCCKAILLQKQYRKIKEVYEADIDMIKQVINGCTELALKTRYKMTKPSKQTGGYFIVFDRQESYSTV